MFGRLQDNALFNTKCVFLLKTPINMLSFSEHRNITGLKKTMQTSFSVKEYDMKKNLFLLTVLLFIGAAQATAAEVGMVTQMNGSIAYQTATDKTKSAAVRNFMKVYEDDSFTLDSNAQIQIVYFESGTKETWKGPVAFKAGKIQGKADSPSAVPKITTMNSSVTGEVKRLAALTDTSRLQKTGSTLVRGKPSDASSAGKPPILSDADKKEISAAKKIYQDLLKDEEASDITPELYLFSVLADYDQFDEMRSLIAAMRKKQPENKDIDLFETWTDRQK